MSQNILYSPAISNLHKDKPIRHCIHEKFEAQVERSPDAIAVSCGDEQLTYRELNSQANQLAQELRANGIGPEIPVALYLERTPRMVVAILGVLKAGGAYVPIDLAYPRERASFMLEDAQAPVLITQEKLRAAVPAGNSKVICIDADWETIAKHQESNLSAGTTADNVAYIIYTSGSTGKPKGVLVTHHNVVRLLEQTAHWYEFRSTDVWPLFHSYAFDVSVWELWGSLFNGGRLVVVPYLVTRSPLEFYRLLAREKVTVLNQTPSAFRQLIWAEANSPVKESLSLRYVICAGEALELQSLKPWFDVHGDEQPKVVNMYGITETTVHSTYRVIRKEDLANGSGSVIGVPIPDLQIYLVDEDLKPVPAGTPGEICVGGAGVARGYLKRPELTAKRFLADPFSEEPGARLYRSGDLAQYSASGELEYLGRMDHQVKIRGFRVELGEIESALNRHESIRESVVLAHESANGDKRLIAYVVPVKELATVTELREYLAQKVPDYMIPAVFIGINALPLTTNGKVDRRALPNPDGLRPDLKSEFVPPRNEGEKVLARLWSEVLEVATVGVHDNFFELGGDSIRSIRILSRAQEEGLQLTLQEMFQHPTVAGMTECASTGVKKAQFRKIQPFELVPDADRVKIPPDVKDAYPVAKLQLGMFFHNELNPDSAVYHDVFTFSVRTRFEREKLERAVNQLVARHPILRTSFNLGDYSIPLQLVHARVNVPFEVEDLRHLSPEEQARQVKAWVETEKRRPFERSTAPLVRFHTHLLEENAFQFIISFHHSCLDGWSLAAAITEIFEDYGALMAGAATKAHSPRITYGDFVAAESAAIASDETRHFWSEKLRDANAQLLPRWPQSLREGGREQKRGPELRIETSVFDGLKKLAQDAGAPLKTVLFAAHQRVMAMLYGQNEVISGLISNGRPEEADGDKMLGLFLNAVPIRMHLDGGTWLELVKATFAAEQEVIPYRRFPMAEIQKHTGGRRLFETAFDFVHFHVYKNLEGQQQLDLREGHYFEANDMTTYTTFMLDVTSTKLELHIDYDPNEISREQVEQISDYYLRTLKAMALEPSAGYERFSALSDNEIKQALVDWNDTGEEETGARIHELFEARAAESPKSIAVVYEGGELTYGELNERANCVAAYLQTLSVRPQEPIGICLNRSMEMVIALLGILKAGGAYLPMDPAYPQERLAFMLDDAHVRVVVTEPGLRGLITKADAEIVDINMAIQSARNGAANGCHHSTAPDLAYVIYTSGSTGKPKGVQVFHRGVVNLLNSAARTVGMTAKDTLLAVTTLSFDIAALEIFMPLILGAKLHVASRETASDGTRLATLLGSSEATIMQATPATWRLLIEAGWSGQASLKVISGGEALQRNLADQLLARSQEVWNFYGPTETTIWSSAWKVTGKGPILIGKPLANTQFYILNPERQLLPAGTCGELYIGGSGLAKGYLDRPELTAERFIRNPFSQDEECRIYRTGDIARFLPDGSVECLGRLDNQVKIRGFRIEPGEIEGVLRQHEGIAEALVTARADAFGDKRLVGYITSRNGPPSITALREFARGKLPHYMIPAQFVVLDQFPLTPNRKVDVRRLPAPEAIGGTRGPLLAPRNSEEKTIAEIWKEVLTLGEIGVDESFFDLGGDSLSATRAFARMNKAFQTELSLGDLFDHPTVCRLAELVKSRHGESAPQKAIPRAPRRAAGVAPVTA